MKVNLIMSVLCMAACVQAAEIKHRFLAKGESRAELHYVNQLNPSEDWTISLPRGCRDIRLLDGERLLVSHPDGYLEYDLKTQTQLKQIAVKAGAQIESVARLPNGHTVLAGRQGCITFYELDEHDQLVREVAFKQYTNIRLFRLSPEGHFLFGANTDHVVEADWSGRVYADFQVAGSKHIYWVKKMDDGKRYRVATGYGHSIVDVAPDGQILRQLGGTDEYYFFSRPFELKNGNIVASHWTGHNSDDSEKAPQLVEFDPHGNVVWQWHEPQRAGTIHGVIMLDD